METSDILTHVPWMFFVNPPNIPQYNHYFPHRKDQKKGFHWGPKCGIHTSGYGVQVPINFDNVSVGFPDYPFKSIWVTIFPKSHSVNLYLFLPTFFQFFALCTQVVAVFVCQASLLTHDFAPFIFWAAFGTPVKLLSLGGSGVGVPIPTKIESIVKTFLLARPLSLS